MNALKNSGIVNAVKLQTWCCIQSLTCDTRLPVMQLCFLTFRINPVTAPSTVYRLMKNFVNVVKQLDPEHLSVCFAMNGFIEYFWAYILKNLRSFNRLFLCTARNTLFFLFSKCTGEIVFSIHCTGVWSFLHYQEWWYFLFPKIWSYYLEGKWKTVGRSYMEIRYFLYIPWRRYFFFLQIWYCPSAKKVKTIFSRKKYT